MIKKNRTYRCVRNLPLSEEEWRAAKRYQRVPLKQKLAWLDSMRSLTFELWKHNPKIYQTHLKFRRGEI